MLNEGELCPDHNSRRLQLPAAINCTSGGVKYVCKVQLELPGCLLCVQGWMGPVLICHNLTVCRL